MRKEKVSSVSYRRFDQKAALFCVFVCVLWISGCDSNSKSRTSSRSDVDSQSVEGQLAESGISAKNENQVAASSSNVGERKSVLKAETYQHVEAMIALAVIEGAETAARRKRVQEGLRQLEEKLPTPDPIAESKCERLRYPCSYAEVPDDIHQRSNELSDEVDERIGRGDDVDEVLEWLLKQDEIVYINASGPTIEFRLREGVPMRMQYKRLGAGRAE